MCGRYASARSVDDIASAFGIHEGDVDDVAAPDWNVAPTKPVTAVLQRDGRRTVTTLRWGLVPSWAPDPSVGPRMINARLETVADKVETALQEKPEREMTTEEIGAYVMRELKGLDKVAFVRFASVYRNFRDIDEFKNELNDLLRTKE